MVYNGPSTGCLACRKRKVRCDKGRPKCNNCTKRKVDCPGYGNTFDSRHRDETRSVIRRVDQKYIRASDEDRSDSDSHGYARVPVIPHQIPDAPSLLSFHLPPAIELSAINFFFNSYGRALGDCRAMHGFMPDLAPLYRNALTHSPLHNATTCVAMNFWMLFSKQGSDTKLARGFYLKALGGLKDELARADPSTYDELIMTVLALDFYDNLNCRFWPDSRVPDHHKRGALALLKHRGDMNFDTEMSRVMTSHVRSSLCHWAIEVGEVLPSDIIDLLTHPSLPSKNSNVLDNLTMLIGPLLSRFRALRAETRHHFGTMADPDLESLLQDALELDEKFAQWEEEVPSRWHPVILSLDEIAPSIRDAGTYNGRCPVYADLAICEVYNTYRHRRLLLLQVIQHLCLRSKDEMSADTFDAKAQLMQRLTDEICESVPFCLGDALAGAIIDAPAGVRYPSTWKNGSPFPHPSVDHPGQAIAQGGWMVFSALGHLMQLIEPDNEMTPLHVRSGQADWAREQLQRCAAVYTFSVPRKATSPRQSAVGLTP